MAVPPGLGELCCGVMAVFPASLNCPMAAHRLAICVEFLKLARLVFKASEDIKT